MDILNTVKGIGLKGISKVKKVSPELLLIGGAVTIVGGVIIACKRTWIAKDAAETFETTRSIIKDTKVGAEIIDAVNNTTIIYTEEDKKKDTFNVYKNLVIDFAKAYAPAAALIGGGFAMIFSSYGILKKRNAGLIAAYTLVSESYKNYRQRVKEKYGEEAEFDIFRGLIEKEEEIKAVSKDGKEKVKKEKKLVKDDRLYSPYAKCFDELNINWRKDNLHNKNFLLMQQNFANDLYNARGHVFLNEVYDMLGFDRTSAGAVTGWVKGKGDDYISFGIDDGVREANRLFVNGEEPSIWLDFNVSGVILDYI